MFNNSNQSGWWLTYPSEKYESQLWLLFPMYGKNSPNVPNHQPENQDWHDLVGQIPVMGKRDMKKHMWVMWACLNSRTFRACEFKQFEGAVSCCESPAFLVEFPSMASPYATSLGPGVWASTEKPRCFGYPPVIWNSNPKSTSPMVLPIKLRG